jgi:uncharacterized protein
MYPKRSQILTPTLVRAVVNGFPMSTNGLHGAAHWFRVRANGLRLAQATGADTEVVELFALFHDSQRLTEGTDPDHGQRGAYLAERFHGRLFHLPDTAFDQLLFACRSHTSGTQADTDDITVRTCWDADRLDLGRVGIMPSPDRLLTGPARSGEILSWAYERSLRYW